VSRHMERRDLRLGMIGSSGWSRYHPMDGVETLGRQAGEAIVSRAAVSGSEMEARDWRRRIMRQCEIGEKIKTNREPSN
jgi:hypothetical protein